MSVLMRGVEMPKNCEECNFKGECRNYWDKIRETYTRPSWCPLVEVAEQTEPSFKVDEIGDDDPTIHAIAYLQKVGWLQEHDRILTEQTEPQKDIHDLTDCDFCKERNCKDCEGGKDEPQKKEVEWVYNKRERLWYPYSNGELLFKTEPQTDCGDFADRLAYERGVKHAWEVAQKVFDSTVTFYEAEDVAKQIADTPQTEQTEPSLEQFRVGLEYHTDATHFGKAKGESTTTNTADTPQTERIKTPDYCDICNHKGCDNCTANNLDDYCVPSGYAPKDTPQTDAEITELAKEIVHKMIDDAVIAEDAYPDLRQKMHNAVERLDEYYPSEDERSE